MEAKATVYLETTIPSYLTAWPSSDAVMRHRQTLTQNWWDSRRDRFDLLISELVIAEMSAGDPDAARRRLDFVKTIHTIVITDEAEKLAAQYMIQVPLLQVAPRDALHVALATRHGLDYLLTWNCVHIARAEVRRAVEAVNDQIGYRTPTICTPEELMGYEP